MILPTNQTQQSETRPPPQMNGVKVSEDFRSASPVISTTTNTTSTSNKPASVSLSASVKIDTKKISMRESFMCSKEELYRALTERNVSVIRCCHFSQFFMKEEVTALPHSHTFVFPILKTLYLEELTPLLLIVIIETIKVMFFNETVQFVGVLLELFSLLVFANVLCLLYVLENCFAIRLLLLLLLSSLLLFRCTGVVVVVVRWLRRLLEPPLVAGS